MELVKVEWHRSFWPYVLIVLAVTSAFLLIPVSSPGAFLGHFFLCPFVLCLAMCSTFFLPNTYEIRKKVKWRRRPEEELILTRGISPAELLAVRYLLYVGLLLILFVVMMLLAVSGIRAMVQSLLYHREIEFYLRFSETRHLWCLFLIACFLSCANLTLRYVPLLKSPFAAGLCVLLFFSTTAVMFVHYYDFLYHLGTFTLAVLAANLVAVSYSMRVCMLSDWWRSGR